MSKASLFRNADLLYQSTDFQQAAQVAANEIGFEWDHQRLQELLATPQFEWFFTTYGDWAVRMLQTGQDRDPEVVATIDRTIRDGVREVQKQHEDTLEE